MRIKVEVGQEWKSYAGNTYQVIRIFGGVAWAVIIQSSYNTYNIGREYFFTSIIVGGYPHLETETSFGGWTLLKTGRPAKAIPDINIPLDPTLHILQAGHIQDRMRRRKK